MGMSPVYAVIKIKNNVYMYIRTHTFAPKKARAL